MATVATAQLSVFPTVGIASASPFLRRNLRVPIYDTSGCSQTEAGRFYALLLRDVKTGRELLGVFLSLGRHLYPYAFCRAVLQTALQRHTIDLEMDWTEVQVSRLHSGARQYYMLGKDSLREKNDLDLESEVSEAACVLLHTFCASWLAVDDDDFSLGFVEADDENGDGKYEFPMPSVCWSVLCLMRKSLSSRANEECYVTTAGLDEIQRQHERVGDEGNGRVLKASSKTESVPCRDGEMTPQKDADTFDMNCGKSERGIDFWKAVAKEVWEFLPLESVGRAFGKLVARGDSLAFLVRRNLLVASLRGDWRATPYMAVYDLVWHADVRRMTRENFRALGLCPSADVTEDNAELDTDTSDEVTPEDNHCEETFNFKDSGESPTAETRQAFLEKAVEPSPEVSPRNASGDAISPVFVRQDALYPPVFSDGEDESPNKLETSSARKRAGRRRRRKGRKQSSMEPSVFRDVSPSPSVSSTEKCSKTPKSCSSELDERPGVEAASSPKDVAAATEQTRSSENLEGSPAKSKSSSKRNAFKRRNRRSRASTSPNETEEKESGKARSGKSKGSRRHRAAKESGKNEPASQNGAEATSSKNRSTSSKAAEIVSRLGVVKGQGGLRADLDRELAAALSSAPRSQEVVTSVVCGEARPREKPRRWSKSRAHTSRNLLSLEADGVGRHQ